MKISYDIFLKKNLILAIFSILFVLVFTTKTNIYWGWVDDTFYQNNFNSLYTPFPIYDPDYFVGLSQIFIFLYKEYPDVGWLGYFLTMLLSISYLIVLMIIINSQTIRKNKLLLYALIIILSCIIQFSLFRLNFTGVSIIGLFAGYFLIAFNNNSQLKFLGFLIFTISLLIRPNVLTVITLQLLIISICNYFIEGKEKKQLRDITYFVISLLVLITLRITLHNADSNNFDVNGRLEWILQDGYLLNVSSEILNNERIRLIYEAIISWNTQDAEILHQNTYLELFKLLYEKNNLLHILIRKLNLSIYFINRYHGDFESFNFLCKYLLLIITFLAISLITLIKTYHSKPFYYFSSVIFSTIGLITIIIFFAKIEERFILIYIWSITLVLFLSCNKHKVKIGFRGLIFFLISLAIGFQYITQSIAQSKILEKNLVKSKNTLKYINNNFKGKTVLLDTYTPYLFNESPFKTIKIDSTVNLSMSLNYTRNYFFSIQNYWKNHCNIDNSYIQSFRCISELKENVVFFYLDYNIHFIKRWNAHFYKEFNDFKLYDQQFIPVDNLYLWDRHQYNFYQLSTNNDGANDELF